MFRAVALLERLKERHIPEVVYEISKESREQLSAPVVIILLG